MTKSIKLDDQVHKDLERIQLKRETFSQAVARLIAFYQAVNALSFRYSVDHTPPPEAKG